MERRKRTRTATAKALENSYVEVSQRRARKTRRALQSLPEGEHEAANGGYAEAHSEPDKDVVLEQITVAGDAESGGSGFGAEGDSGPKQETQEEGITPAHGQLYEDEKIGKKRRKVGATSQEAQRNDARNTGPQSPNVKVEKEIASEPRGQEETSDIADVADEKIVKQEGNGNADSDSPDDRSHKPNGSNAVSFTSGVELPIQPNKRKDITGSGAEIGSEPLSAELTPKRPRRSSNGDASTNSMKSKQDSPRKRATNGKERGNTASPAKAGVAAAETPVYSTRRRAQVKYKECSDEEDDYVSESALARGSSPLPKAAASRSNKRGKGGARNQHAVEQPSPKARKGRKGVWDKEVLLTNKKSRLTKAADLSDVLNSATWDLLSPEEQRECLALLPMIDKVYGPADPSNPNVDPNGEAILGPDFFESNQVFKDSLVEFQDDLSQGRYEPSYIAEAAKARKARLEGAVDKYKDGQFELFWGQRQQFGMIAGAAANIKLPELIQMGLLKAGDVWAYKRTFEKVTTLEKEVRVAEVTNDEGKYSLVFHIPPGKNKFSTRGIDDIVLPGVVSPQTLETTILRTHPKTPNHIPNGNSFKVFNIWRNGEDLGLLWEIRQTYWGGE